LKIFDDVVEKIARRFSLNLNVDNIIAAAFLRLDFPQGCGAGLFLWMRAAAMIAHVIEKRKMPASGTTRVSAIKHIDSIPIVWI